MKKNLIQLAFNQFLQNVGIHSMYLLALSLIFMFNSIQKYEELYIKNSLKTFGAKQISKNVFV